MGNVLKLMFVFLIVMLPVPQRADAREEKRCLHGAGQ
jgi:hypothetical protein